VRNAEDGKALGFGKPDVRTRKADVAMREGNPMEGAANITLAADCGTKGL